LVRVGDPNAERRHHGYMQRDYIHYRDNAGCVGNIHKLVRMVEQLVRRLHNP